jgi:hypothetical protein
VDPECIFLAGYGAGGAALLLLSGSSDFTARYPSVRGIIAVESPLLSVLQGEEEAFPGPQIPVLFLVSDRILNPKYRDKQYKTILRVFYQTEGPSVIAAIPGAGPLDYSDVSGKYPLFSALFPGGKKRFDRPYIHRRTAALMANFGALILEEDRGYQENWVQAPQKTGFDEAIHVETGRTWNYPGKEYIL